MPQTPDQTPPPGIVVLGSPRSGTTLLRRLFDAHPEVSAPGETYLLSSAARFLEGQKMVDGLEVGVLNGLGFLGFDEAEVLKRLRALVFGFRQEHAEREGKARWLEKTAIDAFHIPQIEKLCAGHARFICVARHGLDVVCSMQDWVDKTQAYPAELHAYIRQHDTPAVAFAHAWADSTASVSRFATAHPDEAIMVRYEDLVENPVAVLEDLCAFLGIAPETEVMLAGLAGQDAKGFSDWKAFGRPTIDASSIGAWRRRLSAEMSGRLAPIVNDELLQHGYDPVGNAAARSDAEARRRYTMALALQKLR